MLYTSYFANIKKLPAGYVPVSIALYPPKGWAGLSYPALFPTPDILAGVKISRDKETYINEYKEKVLGKLSKEQVMNEINQLVGGKTAVLCCYEKPIAGEFYCHRQLVAEFLGIQEFSEPVLPSLFD